MRCFDNKKFQKLFYTILLSALLTANGYAGIMIGGTRFIYHEENEKGLSFLVKNSDNSPYLIQTKILPDNTQGNNIQQALPNSGLANFVATPPLLPLRKKQENYIRVIRTEGKLPNDRESLFQLSITAIPSGRPTGNDLQLAIRSRYKLIYRPSGLKGETNQAYQQLRWQRHGDLVTVENPTPYYVTFQMDINGKLQPAKGVVAPFGSRTESWCPKNGGCDLKWQSLDDLGTPTPAWAINPNATASLGNAIANASPVVTPLKSDEKKPDENSSEAHSSPAHP
uniref:fimbrial biogenesis chaperone n=1 Tax=Hafnia alvei TaxID=569 RepID=UPI0026EBC5D3|nr:molecular chaperone [Hafnia alvei]